MNWHPVLFAVAVGITTAANSGSSTLDAAIGGGVGGAAGAAIGNEVGGREGAIAGSALGAAVGTALNTDSQPERRSSNARRCHHDPRSHRRPYKGFCSPGQAKEGRC